MKSVLRYKRTVVKSLNLASNADAKKKALFIAVVESYDREPCIRCTDYH